jgi:hypothetical protein
MLCHQINGNSYYVMKFLGYKNIRNTRTYIHLAEVIFSKEDHEFMCEPATTVEEAKALIEAGFSYECEDDDSKLFKKIKYYEVVQGNVKWAGIASHSRSQSHILSYSLARAYCYRVDFPACASLPTNKIQCGHLA